MKRIFALTAALLLIGGVSAFADGFRHPAAEIERLTMASPLPSTNFSPDHSKAVMAYRTNRHVPIAELAASEARIGGIRVDPRNFSETRENWFDRLDLLDVATGTVRPISGLPANPRIKFLTWSPSGRYVAFTLTYPDHVELWRADVAKAQAERLTSDRVNTVFGGYGGTIWFLDDEHILFKRVPDSHRQAPAPTVAKSSVVQEVLGEKKSIRTYQDLLGSPADEELYDYVCTSQLAVWGPEGVRTIGAPAIYRSIDLSPDASYAMVVTEHHPYSYVQSHSSFPSKQFIMDLADGSMVRMLRDGTVKEPKPDPDAPKDKKKEPQKPKPSGFSWRPDMPATLYWTESDNAAGPMGPMGPRPDDNAADKDTAKEKDRPEKTFTDRVYQCGAPFDFENDKQLVVNPEYRLGRITWGDDKLALYEESSSKQKFRRTVCFVPCDTNAVRKVLFTQTTEVDTLGDFPVYGRPYTARNQYGRNVLWTDAKHSYIYLTGNDRPNAEGFRQAFLDRLTLKDAKMTQVWKSSDDCKETLSFITDYNPKQIKFVGQRQAFGVVPDYWAFDLRNKKKERQITHIVNPVPQFAQEVTDQYVTYTRKDGLKCFAHLYLPAGYDKERDGRLPVFMWTYPYEFRCFAEAEKARPEKHKFTKPGYGSAMIWATQGYAVLDEFTMAIVAADKDSLPNDQFLSQLVMSAEAAVDFVCDSLGIGDRDRIGVGGHSYGGFMTANLLAHTKLFRAGIARSGAYNRSLTPFGFQSERRNYWKAKDVYDQMSPFNYADKIKDALMLIHGQMDNNTGTFPVQSERLYQALVYFGGTARYVQLPYESHGYQGIETTLDMLYETGAWLDKYVKEAKPRKKAEKKAEKADN